MLEIVWGCGEIMYKKLEISILTFFFFFFCTFSVWGHVLLWVEELDLAHYSSKTLLKGQSLHKPNIQETKTTTINKCVHINSPMLARVHGFENKYLVARR